MGTFEMNCEDTSVTARASVSAPVSTENNRGRREECIVALKVYDQCRQLLCNML